MRMRITNPEQDYTERKTAVEMFMGDVASAPGKPALRQRSVIDRRGNRAWKVLTDPTTDEVVYYDPPHPLSEHQGRGSAKLELRRQPYRRRGARRS